jgi:uncharacterized membrane protein (DUF441 family)
MAGLILLGNAVFLCIVRLVRADTDRIRVAQIFLGLIAAICLTAAIREAGTTGVVLKVLLTYLAGVGIGFLGGFDPCTMVAPSLVVGPIVGWFIWLCLNHISFFPGRPNKKWANSDSESSAAG